MPSSSAKANSRDLVEATKAGPLGGKELIGVYTTFLVDGTLFYYLTIVPENDAEAFQQTFRKIGESIRLTEAR